MFFPATFWPCFWPHPLSLLLWKILIKKLICFASIDLSPTVNFCLIRFMVNCSSSFFVEKAARFVLHWPVLLQFKTNVISVGPTSPLWLRARGTERGVCVGRRCEGGAHCHWLLSRAQGPRARARERDSRSGVFFLFNYQRATTSRWGPNFVHEWGERAASTWR